MCPCLIPDWQHVEVSSIKIQHLILGSSEAKSNSEDRENQGQKPSQNKKNCPERKPRRGQANISILLLDINHTIYSYHFRMRKAVVVRVLV